MTSAPTPGSRLQGRRIAVTGGASGIGLEVVHLFAAQGATVAVLDLAGAAAEAAGAAAGGIGGQVDVADDASVAAAIGRAASALGGLDGLVNAAGVFSPALLPDTDVGLWTRMISINLTGTFLACRHAIPLLEQAEHGAVVNIASSVALRPPGAGGSAYAASKGGVLSLTRALAAEYAPRVRVNSVCPGMVDTPMTDKAIRNSEGGIHAEVTQRYAMQRVGRPDEIAAAILFLMSAEAGYVTGIALPVDGGRTYH